MTTHHTESPELCFNLWAFADEKTSVIRRISGKPYVLDGTDIEKTALLRALSASDFLSVAQRPVPARHHIVGPAGRAMDGAVLPHQLDDVAGVFGPLLDELSVLPIYLRHVTGRHEQWRLPHVDAPLYVLTVIVERADGRREPQLEAHSG